MIRHIVTLCLVVFGLMAFNNKKPSSDVVTIGMLISADTAFDPTARNAARAAILAVETKNQQRGINGQAIKLVIKSCDGKWGAGSKQAVDLVYEENAQVIIGALEGQNAHLAEQVATKAQVVYLETKATDPTLAQINIPWFFRTGLNDVQISEALVDELFASAATPEIFLVTSQGYDHKMAYDTFQKSLTKKKLVSPPSFSIDGFLQLKSKYQKNPSTLIFFGDAKGIVELQASFPNAVIYWSSTSGGQLPDIQKGHLVYLPVFNEQPTSALKEFYKSYHNKYHMMPSYGDALTYDGVCLALEMIGVGKDRNQLQEAFLGAQFRGATGRLEFENSGNRKGKALFVRWSDFHEN